MNAVNVFPAAAARTPGFAELRARAEALVPALRERAREAEAERRVPEISIEELQRAQLFEVQKLARFGGYELGMAEFVELVAVLGRGCGSTAWIYSVTAERAWLLAKFSEHAPAGCVGGQPQGADHVFDHSRTARRKVSRAATASAACGIS